MPESDIYTTPNRCLFILIALKGRDDINVCSVDKRIPNAYS